MAQKAIKEKATRLRRKTIGRYICLLLVALVNCRVVNCNDSWPRIQIEQGHLVKQKDVVRKGLYRVDPSCRFNFRIRRDPIYRGKGGVLGACFRA